MVGDKEAVQNGNIFKLVIGMCGWELNFADKFADAIGNIILGSALHLMSLHVTVR